MFLSNRRFHWFALIILLIILTILIYRTLGIAADILLLALATAYLIRPLIIWLEKKGIGRVLATIVTIVVVGGLIVLAAALVAPFIYEQLKELVVTSPQILQNLIKKWNEISTRYSLGFEVDADHVLEVLRTRFSENVQAVLKPAFETAKSIITSGIGFLLVLVNIFLFPLFFYYLTKEYESIGEFLYSLVPPRFHPSARAYAAKFDTVLAGFVRGQLLDCTFLAAMYGLGLALTGVKFGLIIGIVSGYLSIIPYVGTGIGIIVASIVTLAYSGSPGEYVGVALTFTIGQLIESFVIQPHIVGNRVGLGPLATMLVVIAGVFTGTA